MTHRAFFALATLCALVLVGGTSRADVLERTITDDGQSMRFDDDALLGNDLGTKGELIMIRVEPKRVTLIRPRVSFVAELTKSVENF